MKGLYIYRGVIIMKSDGGWVVHDDPNIYKTIEDAKNGTDKRIGGHPTGIIPKRHDRPIKVIGKLW